MYLLAAKTGGGARWNYLAAWAWAQKANGGDETKAREFVKTLYQHESDDADGRGISNRPPQRAASTDLSVVVRRFKTFVAYWYAVGVAESGWPRYHGHVWQRRYFDRIVRDGGAAAAIRHYVLANPRFVPTRSVDAALGRRLLWMDSHLGDTDAPTLRGQT